MSGKTSPVAVKSVTEKSDHLIIMYLKIILGIRVSVVQIPIPRQ
jgi:hypothetical protein